MEFMPYSFYLAFGIFLSHCAHIYVYHKNGGTELATWFSQFGIFSPLQVVTATQLATVFCISLFLIFQISFPFIIKFSLPKIFSISIFVTIIICIFSNLITSSIMRISYEALFCMIPFAAIILKLMITGSSASQLSDALKFIIPLCIGLPIVMGGSGFIASFYQKQQTTIQLQLYRHVIISTYFFIGAFGFIIYPIIKQILIMKK